MPNGLMHVFRMNFTHSELALCANLSRRSTVWQRPHVE